MVTLTGIPGITTILGVATRIIIGAIVDGMAVMAKSGILLAMEVTERAVRREMTIQVARKVQIKVVKVLV